MYQQPPRGNGWGGVEHAHQRIDELVREFGDMRSDVATIKADMLTEEKFRALMDWGPRREEQTYRGWQNASYQQLQQIPAQQMQQRGLGYQADQTRAYHTQNLLLAVTIVVTPLLSILFARLFG